MQTTDLTAPIGRIFLSAIFIIYGMKKIFAYAATQGYMESHGIPGLLLPLVIIIEIGGGLALATGFFTRWTALILAGFTITTALIFHFNFADRMQAIMFWKNIAITGGLLMVWTLGPGAYSLDKKRQH